MRFMVVALGMAVGCTPLLEDGFEAELTEVGGCGDVVFYAVDADDTTMLSVRVDGLIAAAQAEGDAVTTSAELPDPRFVVTVEQGEKVSDAMCDDVIENGGPRVTRTWTATSGAATAVVWPGDSALDAEADLVLEGVEFDAGDGHAARLEALEWTGVQVGWFAG